MQARDRAVKRKALLDAERAKTDELIVTAATKFIDAADAKTEAEEAISAAEVSMRAAVDELAKLGQTNKQIATLCEIDEGQVRVYKKRTPREVEAERTPELPAGEGEH